MPFDDMYCFASSVKFFAMTNNLACDPPPNYRKFTETLQWTNFNAKVPWESNEERPTQTLQEALAQDEEIAQQLPAGERGAFRRRQLLAEVAVTSVEPDQMATWWNNEAANDIGNYAVPGLLSQKGQEDYIERYVQNLTVTSSNDGWKQFTRVMFWMVRDIPTTYQGLHSVLYP